MPLKIGLLFVLLFMAGQMANADECRGIKSRDDWACSRYDNFKQSCRNAMDCCWYHENTGPVCRGVDSIHDWSCRRETVQFFCESSPGCKWIGDFVCD